MYTIDAPRLRAVSSAEIVHSYPLSQFCCTINIKTFGHNLYLQSLALKSFLCQTLMLILLLLYPSPAHLWQLLLHLFYWTLMLV